MQIRTTLTTDLDDALEAFRPEGSTPTWDLVASGAWSEDRYHEGHIAYYLTKTIEGVWLMDAVERNSCLDGVTEEDVAEGALNDDQVQAMWGMSLEEAQNQEFRMIVAVIEDAPEDVQPAEIARILYEEIQKHGGKVIDESDSEGLLEL